MMKRDVHHFYYNNVECFFNTRKEREEKTSPRKNE